MSVTTYNIKHIMTNRLSLYFLNFVLWKNQKMTHQTNKLSIDPVLDSHDYLKCYNSVLAIGYIVFPLYDWLIPSNKYLKKTLPGVVTSLSGRLLTI